MERLTEKNKAGYCLSRKIVIGKGAMQIASEITDKLGQLEDIEEELDIDLVTFFKYLDAKEVFFTNDFNEIQRAVVRSINKKGLIVFEEAFSWGECDFTLYFKDYGKKWALTKEELL